VIAKAAAAIANRTAQPELQVGLSSPLSTGWFAGVCAASAQKRSLGCERHHVEFAGADRNVLANILCDAEACW